MDSLLYAFLGVLQGFTEFLPISSSGHLALFEHFYGYQEQMFVFDILVHLATALAIALYFRRELVRLFLGLGKFRREPSAEEPRLIILFVIATVITGFAGIFGKRVVVESFGSPLLITGFLFVTGIVLLAAEKTYSERFTVAAIPLWHALVIGVAQSCALFPGLSRSGFTIACALALGWPRETAFRFSFILALPAICGASALAIKDMDASSLSMFPQWIAGFALAFGAGYLALVLLKRFVLAGKLAYFSYYLFIASALAAAFIIGRRMT